MSETALPLTRDASMRRDNWRMVGKLTVVVALMFAFGYALVPIVDLFLAGGWRAASLDTIALHWFNWTVFVVGLRVAYLIWKHNFRLSMVWLVKLVSDPLTDLMSYVPALARRA